MKIKIKAFANVKEAFGFDEKDLTVSDGITVREVIEQFKTICEPLNEFNGSLLYAVNEAYCPESTVLMDEDTLAIFPPVSGG
ncbi:MAG: MoaD/ThiS family protein [Spirochaetes bacterium]|nr:MoaD/ThiS family protein [Spirochaetota bacterium]